MGNVQKALRGGVRFTRALVRSGIESSARRLRDEAVARGKQAWSIPEDDGYVKFDTASLAGTEGAVAKVSALCAEWTRDPVRTTYDKLFPYNLFKPDDLLAYPEFVKLALHDDIIAGIAKYFDQVPRLYNLYMWWTPPNQTLKGSQLYHYDHRDSRQAKVFINISNVTPEAGPLHFLSARDSLAVDAKVGYSQDRYTDEQVYSAVSKPMEKQALGPSGSAYLVDTARCLHFGSRGNQVQRLVLMASFARANSVGPGAGCRVLDPVREKVLSTYYSGDPVREFVLTVAK
jgi:hypothetical protein